VDTQQVEILGRNRLVAELIAADLEVAIPLRDRGVDVIAYADQMSQTTAFKGCPIQLKASSARSFAVDKKYEKFANIVLAYVWGLAQLDLVATYALTYPEAVKVAEDMGWVTTATWAKDGCYTTSNPSARLLDQLKPFLMTPEKWRAKVLAIQHATT
jgi:hypothetical protein